MRRLIISLAVAAAVLLLAEGAVRLVSSRLPEPLEWHSYEAQLKVDQMDELAAQGGADVVFLGSSMTDGGIDPSQFVAEASVPAYNASISQGFSRVIEVWFDEVVRPRLRPKVLVLGLTSLDLQPGGEARVVMYDNLVSAPAARRVLDRASFGDRVEHRLESWSALVRYRRALRSPQAMWDMVRGREPALGPEAETIAPLGWQTFQRTERFEDRSPLVAQTLRLALANYAVGGPDVDALGRLITENEARGVRVVLLSLPVTEEYIALHPNGAADFAVYEQALANIAVAGGADLVDLDGIRDPALFADEHHLNGQGAQRLTHDLVAALRDLGAVPPTS